MFREKPMFWSVGTAWHYIGYSDSTCLHWFGPCYPRKSTQYFVILSTPPGWFISHHLFLSTLQGYESNNTENIGFDKKIYFFQKKQSKQKKQTRKPKPRKKQENKSKKNKTFCLFFLLLFFSCFFFLFLLVILPVDLYFWWFCFCFCFFFLFLLLKSTFSFLHGVITPRLTCLQVDSSKIYWSVILLKW